jgi:hypothetical protein
MANMIQVVGTEAKRSLDNFPADDIAAAHAEKLATANATVAGRLQQPETDGVAAYCQFVNSVHATTQAESLSYFSDLPRK